MASILTCAIGTPSAIRTPEPRSPQQVISIFIGEYRIFLSREEAATLAVDLLNAADVEPVQAAA